uniref:Myb-like domain-containing protein n=1 Tax=Mesocestoides corti TaxID=53468 RepID=A0A5K3F205_MESCO
MREEGRQAVSEAQRMQAQPQPAGSSNGGLVVPQSTGLFPQPTQMSFEAPSEVKMASQPLTISQAQPFLIPTTQFTIPTQQPTPMAPAGTNLPITQLSLAEMESIISPLTRRRSEGFVQQEVKLMIKEIEKRRHILLSVSPSHNKLKRRAWEEVANSMALKCPHEPRRTGEQIKKKWENIVSKTKKKIRDGHVTPELDWNETNTMVMQFLASATQEMRARQHAAMYGSPQHPYCGVSAAPPPSSSPSTTHFTPATFAVSSASPPVFPSATMANTEDTVAAGQNCVSNMAIFPDGKPLHKDPATGAAECKPEELANAGGGATQAPESGGTAASVSTIDNTDDVDDDNDDASDTDNDMNEATHSVFSSSLPTAGVPMEDGLISRMSSGNTLLNGLNFTLNRQMLEELMQQAREEHQLRMEILRLQKRVWHLRVEALSKGN